MPRARLTLDVTDPGAERSVGDMPLYARARSRLHTGVIAYGVAGGLFALTMTVAVLWSSGIEFYPVRFLTVFWVYAWPVVLTVWLVRGSSSRDALVLCAGYGAVLAVLGALALARSPELTAAQIAVLWTITNVPPALLIYAFLARAVRAVGPLVLVLLLLSVTGPVVALAVLGNNEHWLRTVAGWAFNIGLGSSGTFVAIIAVGLVVFAVLGWFTVGWIRRGYVEKRLTDQSIMLDAMWLLFAGSAAIGLAFEGSWWAISGVVAFLVYKLAVNTAFRISQPKGGSTPTHPTLLLLRVFSLGKRSEPLFDAVTTHWRYLGNVRLIAGPDLATTTVEPHEFLEFVSGKLSRLFIDGPKELDRRVATLDTHPDFDGRFRIHDFFCYDDTWQAVLSDLVKSSDAVLMDLRGFTRQRAGCVRELNELVNVVPLSRVVLVIDGTTDGGFLEQTLKDAWDGVRADSPNVRAGSTAVKVVRLPRVTARGVSALLARLTGAAAHDATVSTG